MSNPPAGWYTDPVAGDMLRWWDGEAWSETEFKLARPAVPPRVRRDLLLGPAGRTGSVFNIVAAAGLLISFVVIAMTVTPWAWGGVVICAWLEIVFIAVAIVVRRFGIADRGNDLIRGLERRHVADRDPLEVDGPVP